MSAPDDAPRCWEGADQSRPAPSVEPECSVPIAPEARPTLDGPELSFDEPIEPAVPVVELDDQLRPDSRPEPTDEAPSVEEDESMLLEPAVLLGTSANLDEPNMDEE